MVTGDAGDSVVVLRVEGEGAAAAAAGDDGVEADICRGSWSACPPGTDTRETIPREGGATESTTPRWPSDDSSPPQSRGTVWGAG